MIFLQDLRVNAVGGRGLGTVERLVGEGIDIRDRGFQPVEPAFQRGRVESAAGCGSRRVFQSGQPRFQWGNIGLVAGFQGFQDGRQIAFGKLTFTPWPGGFSSAVIASVRAARSAAAPSSDGAGAPKIGLPGNTRWHPPAALASRNTCEQRQPARTFAHRFSGRAGIIRAGSNSASTGSGSRVSLGSAMSARDSRVSPSLGRVGSARQFRGLVQEGKKRVLIGPGRGNKGAETGTPPVATARWRKCPYDRDRAQPVVQAEFAQQVEEGLCASRRHG